MTLFRGVPFPSGTSTVVRVDPATGHQSAVISGLKTAIAVIRTQAESDVDLLVLQHSSGGPFFGGPGLVLHFEPPLSASTTIANCLARPTALLFDEKTGALYVSEYLTGKIVKLQLGPQGP